MAGIEVRYDRTKRRAEFEIELIRRVYMLRKFADSPLYFLRALLDLERIQPDKYGLQIGQERSRRHDDNFIFAGRALDQIFIFSRTNLISKEVVINTFRWDEHE